ncbi:MAG TPA: HAD family hydrolase [Bacteroidales bacterium]|nr:HAD family hydrolase [Bacteroidales bacterium]
MDFTRYRHIIWDWNGTLLDDAWLCVEVMNGMLKKRGLPLLTLEIYRSIFDFPVKDYYIKLGFDFEQEPFEKVGMEFMVLYNLRQRECSLHPEVKQVLETVHEKGYLQSILSAREEQELRQEVKQLGVSPFFKEVYGLDDHYAHGKTDVGIRLLQKLNTQKEQVLFIGDTLHDAEVARELGIDCILVPNGHQSEERLRRCECRLTGSLKNITEWL